MGDSLSRILVFTTWGSPSSWKRVSYSVEKPKTGRLEREVKVVEGYYKSTLAPLVSVLDCKDTNSNEPKCSDIAARIFVADTIAALEPQILQAENYNDIVGLARRHVEKFLEDKEYVGEIDYEKDFHIVPGMGVFNARGSSVRVFFHSPPSMYMANV